jgi:hypothetical protein
MASITAELKKHAKSWPFRNPVNGEEVPDYYKIIKTPMGKEVLLFSFFPKKNQKIKYN